MSKIGIMGGTFNPIHNGHLFLAENARVAAGLDKVLFMPSKNPPHKEIASRITQKQRSDMVKLAIKDNPYFEFSDYELCREGYTYTADTLTLLRRDNPNEHYYFIVGSDSLFMMQNWMHPELVFKNCTVLAAGRDSADTAKQMDQIDYLKQTFDANIMYLEMPMIDISSEDIRCRIKDGKSVRYYIPDTVKDYIDKNRLYGYNQEV